MLLHEQMQAAQGQLQASRDHILASQEHMSVLNDQREAALEQKHAAQMQTQTMLEMMKMAKEGRELIALKKKKVQLDISVIELL